MLYIAWACFRNGLSVVRAVSGCLPITYVPILMQLSQKHVTSHLINGRIVFSYSQMLTVIKQVIFSDSKRQFTDF